MLVTQEFTVKVDNKTILNDVHIEFGPGIHILMGPNGVGKSSFANALMGHFNYETTGAVEFFGKEKGVHARSAMGVYMLPNNIPVEIEAILELKIKWII